VLLLAYYIVVTDVADFRDGESITNPPMESIVGVLLGFPNL